MNTARPRIVVTGAGLINPLGHTGKEFWSALLEGRSAIGTIDRFDPAGLPISLAGQVRGFDPRDHIPRRFIVKSDRFAHYALAAADQALTEADLGTLPDPFRTGISFGNNSGGWDICERGFEEYYQQSPTMINPWQATAWFPTAPQGFVSIRFGVRGFSKSFACDRASGGCGLLFAARSIAWGYNDVVLTGGAEAPITRLGVAAHVSTGELSRATSADQGYLPYGRDRNGLVLGEGGSVVVFERLDHAVLRNAPIRGEILSIEQRTGADTLVPAIEGALAAAGCAPSDIDVVFAEGCGTADGDLGESRALAAVFGPGAVPVTAPKAAYGHLYGAASGTEVISALHAIEDGWIPPTAPVRALDPDCELDLVTQAREQTVDRALLIARSREGTNVALVVGRFHD